MREHIYSKRRDADHQIRVFMDFSQNQYWIQKNPMLFSPTHNKHFFIYQNTMQSLFDSMNICVSPVGNVSLHFMATRGLIVSRTSYLHIWSQVDNENFRCKRIWRNFVIQSHVRDSKASWCVTDNSKWSSIHLSVNHCAKTRVVLLKCYTCGDLFCTFLACSYIDHRPIQNWGNSIDEFELR